MVTHDGGGGVTPNFYLSLYLNQFWCSPVALTQEVIVVTVDTIVFHTGSYQLAEYTNTKCNLYLPPHIILVHYISILLLFLYLCLR